MPFNFEWSLENYRGLICVGRRRSNPVDGDLQLRDEAFQKYIGIRQWNLT